MLFNLVLHVRSACAEIRLSPAKRSRRQLMPARETEAIILKTFSLGEADRLVSFLGRTFGTHAGCGCRRAPDQKPVRFDAGDFCRTCSSGTLKTRRGIWCAFSSASCSNRSTKSQSDYELVPGWRWSAKVEQVLPEHETAESMFRLLLLTVREMERTGERQLPLSYFAFWTVRLAGWLPRSIAVRRVRQAIRDRKRRFRHLGIRGCFCERASPRRHEAGLKGGAASCGTIFSREKLDKIEFAAGHASACGGNCEKPR